MEIPFRKKFYKRLIREQNEKREKDIKQNKMVFFALTITTSFSSSGLEKPGCKRLLKPKHRDT